MRYVVDKKAETPTAVKSCEYPDIYFLLFCLTLNPKVALLVVLIMALDFACRRGRLPEKDSIGCPETTGFRQVAALRLSRAVGFALELLATGGLEMSVKKGFLDKEVYTTYDAARICNANIASIKNWIAKGLLRAFRTPGGHYRIKRRDLELFVQKYNMPYPFEAKAQKIVYLLDTDKGADKLVGEAAAGHHYESFTDAMVAALRIGLERPDLLILNYKAKGLDGERFLEVLHDYPDTRNIRLILFTKGLSADLAAALRKRWNLEDIVDKSAGKGGLVEALARLS